MSAYGLTLEKFHKGLKDEKVVSEDTPLRRTDIEYILTKVRDMYPKESEIARYERATDAAAQLFGLVKAHKRNLQSEPRKDGEERRKVSLLETLTF